VMAGAFPGEFDAPDAAANALLISGVFQAVIPNQPYKRYIRAIQVFCTVASRVVLYLDAITPAAQIAQNPTGANNTWGPVNTRPIPINSRILVVWPDVTTAQVAAGASAYCVISAGGVIGG